MRAFARSRQEQFPDTAAEQTTHRVYPAIPAVEIADDADALRVRRPDSDIHASCIANRAKMRAELFVELLMIALGKQMQIHLAHDQAVAVGIADERRRFIPAGKVDVIVDVAFHSRKCRLEKSFGAQAFRSEALFRFSVDNDAHFFCVRAKYAHDQIVADAMRPEGAERIRVRAGKKDVQLIHGHTGNFERAHARTSNLMRLLRMSRPAFAADAW